MRKATGGRAQPITHQQFTGSASMRQRYWARSMLGWRVIGEAAPNAAHHALARCSTRAASRGSSRRTSMDCTMPPGAAM
jgi:hypothetical protein